MQLSHRWEHVPRPCMLTLIIWPGLFAEIGYHALPAGAHRKGTRAAPRHTVALHWPPTVQQSQGPLRWLDMQCLCLLGSFTLLCCWAVTLSAQMYSSWLPAWNGLPSIWVLPGLAPNACSRKSPECPSNDQAQMQRLSCPAPHLLLQKESLSAPALALHTCSLGDACPWSHAPSQLLLHSPTMYDSLIAACRWRPKPGSSGNSRQ